MTTRRRFLAAFGAGTLALPLRAFAQQPNLRRVGFLYFASRQSALETGRYEQFLAGMHGLGYADGKDYELVARFADGASERLPGLVEEMARIKVDVIVATGTPVVAALKHAGGTTPVVMTVGADPVGEGYAATLARPGGRFTGLATGNAELFAKHVELLKVALPKLSRIAILWNPANDSHPARLKKVLSIAQGAGLKATQSGARTSGEIERGFDAITRERAQAVVILNDAVFVQQMKQIAGLAVKHRLPSLYGAIEYAEVGGLIGYGQNVLDNFQRAASYVDKILKGAKPGDLPIEQPTRVSLAINRRTARAIGFPVPQELLLRADKVIE
jgi:ABC-type uncharacterized transport system substrate-binding protein